MQLLEREPRRVQRQQREDLGLAAVEQQPLAVEPGLGRAEQGQVEAGDHLRVRVAGQAGVLARLRHGGLDQAGHHPRGGQADRVGAVPGGRQVDDAELLAADRVVHGRRPADPVVHDLGVVLGAEHHRGRVVAGGQVEGVGADAGVVPAPTGHEVHGLGLAAHHASAVRPEDAGLGVGHGHHEVAVLRRTTQLLLDPLDGHLERRALPERPGVGLVGERRLAHVDADGGRRALPGAEDLGPHQAFGEVAVLDEVHPRAHGVHPLALRAGCARWSSVSPGVTAATLALQAGRAGTGRSVPSRAATAARRRGAHRGRSRGASRPLPWPATAGWSATTGWGRTRRRCRGG